MDKRIRDSKRVVVADAGHDFVMEKPFEFNRIVLDFISGL